MKKFKMLLLAMTLFAAHGESFNYNGQKNETVNLEQTKEVTLYKTEYVDSTCTREVPYEDEVCGNETRYRQECHWEPSRQHCYDEPDTVCRDVTRYRNECTRGPSRRVCENEPSRQVCTNGPSRQECHNEPSRQVCRTRNGQTTCRDVPGRRVCRDVPGRRTCRTEPGRRVCRDVPGEQRCRQVPYNDRVCDTVHRRRCDTIPAQNVCRDVPYDEWVCRNVTRYRTETYACKKPVQVPYKAQKKFVDIVEFNFTDVDSLGQAKINVELNEQNVVAINFKNLESETTYIQAVRETQIVSDSDELKEVKTVVKVNFGSLEKLLSPLSTKLSKLWMNKEGEFALTTAKNETLKDAKVLVDVVKRSNNERHFKKEFIFEQFNIESRDKDQKLLIDLGKHGFDKLTGLFGSGVKLKVAIKLSVQAPTHLVAPIAKKLEVTKTFNIKVYKNK